MVLKAAKELRANGTVIAASLAEKFGVSEDTARRDLRELAKAGECRRVYGGAIAPAPYAGSMSARGVHAKALIGQHSTVLPV